MSDSHRILVFGDLNDDNISLVDQLKERGEVVVPESLEQALHDLQDKEFSGIVLIGQDAGAATHVAEAGGILELLPEGVALLDAQLNILWANRTLNELTGQEGSLTGLSFYAAFGSPEIIGPDFCPFHTALGSGESARSTLRVGEKSYFEVHARPVFITDIDIPSCLVVVVRDVSEEVLQRQKLNAIYQAGLELGDLSPQEVYEMSVGDRIELLKQKILHYTEDLLEFETVEIRLVEKKTKKLEPLLAVGMGPVAADRALFAEPAGHGVTGFVASTGKSYLCEDTANDPLYLPGAPGARSSLTVPLILHDEILGTINVESPRPGAFNEHDLQFLELFSREVSMALNTLELLVAEKMTTASESTERILREVAHPVDEILNDAAWILERYIGHEPNVCDRLQRVLRHTRDIKQLIQKVGRSITPDVPHSPLPPRPERPRLQNKRVLVVDSDDTVRGAAHELLGRFGCEVETAHNGDEAFLMVRSFHYDVVIADIRLPDMTGFDCFHQLRQIHEHLPVILMTGFGYDPSHSIVKARQLGLKSVLYKPFRLDQLLNEVEKAVTRPGEAEA
ncbi:MAG: response regulator [Planctomycetaceae bacterium]|nr:response regulator [Planctomycetaceae bacterium]